MFVTRTYEVFLLCRCVYYVDGYLTLVGDVGLYGPTICITVIFFWVQHVCMYWIFTDGLFRFYMTVRMLFVLLFSWYCLCVWSMRIFLLMEIWSLSLTDFFIRTHFDLACVRMLLFYWVRLLFVWMPVLVRVRIWYFLNSFCLHSTARVCDLW